MLRKRKQPTPSFKLPSPFQPITGERAKLLVPGFFPYCAMMQVAAEDTHQDYVLCRGFDVRIARFIDYDAGDLENSPGIPVAKPFSNRGTGLYTIAHIFPAFLPLQTGNPSPAAVLWRVGQNPGVAATTIGQPADLNEEVEILYTDDDPPVAINWMMVDSGVKEKGDVLAKLTADLCPSDQQAIVTDGEYLGNCEEDASDITTGINIFTLSGKSGAYVLLKWRDCSQEWIVVQIQHREFGIVADTNEDYLQYTDCKIQTKSLLKTSIMSCEDPAWVDDIQLVEHDLLIEPEIVESGEQVCGSISFFTKRFCLFDDPAAVAAGSMTFGAVDVCVDLYDDGECVKAVYQAICVAGVLPGQTEEDIICGVDCVSGSGSGSGSGEPEQ